MNFKKQKRYVRDVTDIHKVSIGGELAWTILTLRCDGIDSYCPSILMVKHGQSHGFLSNT